MEPAAFLQEMIQLAEEINKFKQFSMIYKEPAEPKTKPDEIKNKRKKDENENMPKPDQKQSSD